MEALDRFLEEMTALSQGGSRCCEDCLVVLTCAHLNREDTLEPREDDDALCTLIVKAIEEYRQVPEVQPC